MLFYKILAIALISILIFIITDILRNKRIIYKKDTLLVYVAILFALLCVVLSVFVDDHDAKIFWNEFKFVAVVFIPVLVLRMNLRFLGIEKFKGLRYGIIFSIVPVITLLAIATNGMHHLFRKEIYVIVANEISYVAVQSGILFTIYSVYQYCILIALIVVFVIRFISLPKIYRMSIAIMIASVMLCFVAILLVVTGVVPDYSDFSLVTVAIAGLLQYYVMAFYNPLGMVFMSRSNAINDIDDEILIFDTDDVLIDANQKAKLSFGFLQKEPFTYNELAEAINFPSKHNNMTCVEFIIGEDIFDITDKMLIDNAHKVCGRVVSFKNISKIKSLMNEMEIIASLDYLTGLSNRRAFLKLLDSYDKNDKVLPLSIVCFSLSSIKQSKMVNDEAFYEATILSFSELLSDMCDGKYECAAINAYDFGVIMCESTETEAFAFAEEVNAKFTELLDEGSEEMSLVFGVATKVNFRQSIHLVFKKASESVCRNLLLYS